MSSNRRVTIVTGPIDSGKTAWCRNLAADHPHCSGVLLPKVYLRGQRSGYDALLLPSGQRLAFARLKGHEGPGWSACEEVGVFTICCAGLQAANDWLARAASCSEEIVVDEAGPLELEGGGLSPGLQTVLASGFPRTVYLVIRRALVEAVCRRFGIREYTTVHIASGASEP
jgi:nucleoside-triphosphatase THEP1